MRSIIYNKEYDKVPAKLWVDFDALDMKAKDQIGNLQNLPFAFKHVAFMPDCHGGFGMPIGGVLATLRVVIPNAVGKDIGCGMCAVKTPWKVDEIGKDRLMKIREMIKRDIPVGFEHHKSKQDKALMPELPASCWADKSYIFQQEYENALTQLGTLGGGNHFIEIQKDTEDNVWIMIHSGSRNLGSKVADYYNDKAVLLNGKWYAHVPEEWELAFFPIDSPEGKWYTVEMQYCVDFALANRKLMMQRIAEVFVRVMNYKTIDLSTMINIAHNYARMESHFGQNVMVHRKGATSAKAGEIGIIPGSQGTKSYIVKGLGNPESFESCSHGAGRVLGRNQAIKDLDLAAEKKKLDDQGILHEIKEQDDLEEAPGAYKDIVDVMANQADLVSILVELSPLAVIKAKKEKRRK